MYVIGIRRRSSFERLPNSPEFTEDQEYEAREWAALYKAKSDIPFAGSRASLEVFRVPQMPQGVH